MRKHSKSIAFFALYTFFYLVLELAINDYAEPVIGSANITYLYGAGYLALAAGYPLYFLLRKRFGAAFERPATLLFAALGGVAFLALSFTASPGWFVGCAIVSHLTSGYIGGAVYCHTAAQLKNFNQIGLAIGIAYAVANIVQATGLVLLYFVSVPAGRWIERVALMLALAVVALGLIARAKMEEPQKKPAIKTPTNIRKYILGALVAVALISILHGVNDGIVTALHAGDNGFIAYGYPRLFAIPGLLVAGAVFDFKDRRFFPYATLLAMIIMAVAVLLFSSPATYNIATCFIYFFGSFMSLFSVVPFMQWAPATTKPALVAVAGRGVRYAFSGLAIIAAGVLFSSASVTLLVVIYVLFLALLFSAFFFMGQLHLPARDQSAPSSRYAAFSECHSLTDRESEVLAMLCAGCSTAEMAKELFIAEKTVRNHISNIFIKTGLRSRTELLLHVRQAEPERERR